MWYLKSGQGEIQMVDVQVSGTLRTVPEDTTTTRDLDATSFSRRRWVR